MANKKKSAGTPVGGRGGNVVVDLGEEVDGMIQHAFSTGYKGKGLGASGSRPSMRPGFFGMGSGFGFRPGLHRSKLGDALQMPASVDPMQVLGGAFAGLAANRVLFRLIPYIAGGRITSKLLVDGLSAGVGILPYLMARKNGFAIGFAIPGIVNLAGSFVDSALNAIKILPSPALSGAQMGAEAAPLAQARAAVDRIRSRMGTIRPGIGAGRLQVQARVA